MPPCRLAAPSVRPGQATVEFALIALLSVGIIAIGLQLSMILAQYYSGLHVSRETARWLAVRVDTTDAAVLTRAQTVANGLPGLADGGLGTVQVTPSCAALTNGKCNGRAGGDAITVTVTTSLAPVMFLPTTYGSPPIQVTFPTTLGPLRSTVMLE